MRTRCVGPGVGPVGTSSASAVAIIGDDTADEEDDDDEAAAFLLPPASALLLLLLLLLLLAAAAPPPPPPPEFPPPEFPPPLLPAPLLFDEDDPPAAPCGFCPVCCSSNDKYPTELLLLKFIGERVPDATKNAAPTRASTTASTEIVRPEERGRDDDDGADDAGTLLVTAPTPTSSSTLGDRNVSSLPYDCRAFALLDDMVVAEDERGAVVVRYKYM
jgi:hypothetical protein